MSSLPLPLAPHELAPNRRADLDGEPFAFRASWSGVERDFVGQVVGQVSEQMIFFALADEPERGHFVHASILLDGAGKRVPPVFEPLTYFRPERARQFLENLADQGWGRVYYLDEDLDVASGEAVVWRLFLAQNGWGQWCGAPDYYRHQARLRWNRDEGDARQTALLPPLEMLARVRAALLEPQGDAALSRQFALLDETQKTGLCRPVRRGSYAEWERVVGWYSLSHPPAHSALARRVSFFVDTHCEQSEQKKDSWMIDGRLRSLPSNAARFCDWTRHYFGPTPDETYLKSHAAAAAWTKRSFQIVAIASPATTQHERLEALLQLRDWLKDKAAPAEIEELLRAEPT